MRLAVGLVPHQQVRDFAEHVRVHRQHVVRRLIVVEQLGARQRDLDFVELSAHGQRHQLLCAHRVRRLLRRQAKSWHERMRQEHALVRGVGVGKVGADGRPRRGVVVDVTRFQHVDQRRGDLAPVRGGRAEVGLHALAQRGVRVARRGGQTPHVHRHEQVAQRVRRPHRQRRVRVLPVRRSVPAQARVVRRVHVRAVRVHPQVQQLRRAALLWHLVHARVERPEYAVDAWYDRVHKRVKRRAVR